MLRPVKTGAKLKKITEQIEYWKKEIIIWMDDKRNDTKYRHEMMDCYIKKLEDTIKNISEKSQPNIENDEQRFVNKIGEQVCKCESFRKDNRCLTSVMWTLWDHVYHHQSIINTNDGCI